MVMAATPGLVMWGSVATLRRKCHPLLGWRGGAGAWPSGSVRPVGRSALTAPVRGRGCSARVSGGRLGGGPELGGAAGRVDLRAVGAAGGGERLQCLFDAFAGLVALEKVAQLGAGHALGLGGERGVDLFGERVAGRVAERPVGRAGGVA